MPVSSVCLSLTLSGCACRPLPPPLFLSDCLSCLSFSPPLSVYLYLSVSARLPIFLVCRNVYISPPIFLSCSWASIGTINRQTDRPIQPPTDQSIYGSTDRSTDRPGDLRTSRTIYRPVATYHQSNRSNQANRSTEKPTNRLIYQATKIPTRYLPIKRPIYRPNDRSTNPNYRSTEPNDRPTNRRAHLSTDSYLPTDRSTNQPNRSIDLLTNQVNQQTGLQTNQRTDQPTIPFRCSTWSSIKQAYTDQPIAHRPTDRSIDRSTDGPTDQPTSQPTDRSTKRSTDQSVKPTGLYRPIYPASLLTLLFLVASKKAGWSGSSMYLPCPFDRFSWRYRSHLSFRRGGRMGGGG